MSQNSTVVAVADKGMVTERVDLGATVTFVGLKARKAQAKASREPKLLV
jgi:hypothetical protein